VRGQLGMQARAAVADIVVVVVANLIVIVIIITATCIIIVVNLPLQKKKHPQTPIPIPAAIFPSPCKNNSSCKNTVILPPSPAATPAPNPQTHQITQQQPRVAICTQN